MIAFKWLSSLCNPFKAFRVTQKCYLFIAKFSVTFVITEINNWMKDETIKKMKEHESYTLLLDEATGKSSRSELCLIALVVESREVQKLFLIQLEHPRCDAESTFKTVEACLIREDLK